MPVSFVQHGEYGVEGVALSIPAIVGKNGIETAVPVSLDEAERAALKKSGDTLKAVLNEAFPE
jgi:L-lactate dehydrogenase